MLSAQTKKMTQNCDEMKENSGYQQKRKGKEKLSAIRNTKTKISPCVVEHYNKLCIAGQRIKKQIENQEKRIVGVEHYNKLCIHGHITKKQIKKEEKWIVIK